MTIDRGQLATELRKRRFRHRLTRFMVRATDITRSVIVVGGLLVAVLIEIPWLREPMKRLGFDNASGVTLTIIVFILVAIFYELRIVVERTDTPSETRHYTDPMDVYPVLLERMRSITRTEEKRLDILGMTLYTAWPTLTFWLNRPELNGWTCRLTAVVRGGPELDRLVPDQWFDESVTNLTKIQRTAQAPAVKQRNITLLPYGYDFMPVVHGFRLGNGDLFYSILSWQGDKIGRDSYSYEYIPCEDVSPSAKAMRDVFDSWFARSCRTPWTDEKLVQAGHEPSG